MQTRVFLNPRFAGLTAPKTRVPGYPGLIMSVPRPARVDKLPLLSLAYMFNRGGRTRPNLLAIIAAQKAQSIQRSVTEARTNLCTQYPCSGKKRAPLLPMSGGLTANESKLTRAVNAATHTAVSDFLPHFNSFLFMRAVLCSTDTRNLNPSNPGFCPHTNPGLRV